ncbi:MAG: CpaF family protein [Candidatus Aenigmarchaeota archaeon]|nr:CpaF family protein [Candidatus Aenigmarchaeota archaeon]
MEGNSYDLTVDGVKARVNIGKDPTEFVPIYKMDYPQLKVATRALLDSIREKLIAELEITPTKILDSSGIISLKKSFKEKSLKLLDKHLPKLPSEKRDSLAGILLHNSLGLGPLEMILHDQNIEEVVINNSKEPVWVYHRKMSWLKTNVNLSSETEIYNFAAMIGRRVGTQITYLNPLMDAYLVTGDRSNATLFPISSKGNTLTIRKFARRPWTITDFIEANTLSPDIAAFLWLAIQYEMNVLIAGGTASGKTSLLNVLSCFIPPNHRIISIEDTREIQIPDFMHWVPLTTRPPNSEGKGEVTMLELLVNSLRMRPDRVLVGEIRRSKEAEVLFEAVHTGHSVYATLHANTAEETVRRLINPPINIPSTLLASLHLIAVMHRDRRREIRRLIQLSEVVSTDIRNHIELNDIFGWTPSKDTFLRMEASSRVMEEIKTYTGMAPKEIDRDLNEKERILKWLVKKQVKDIQKVGEIISTYYTNPEKILKRVKG